jgi:hypothetical protein
LRKDLKGYFALFAKPWRPLRLNLECEIPLQKQYPSFVLANPYFPDWRNFGQNPELISTIQSMSMGFTHG